jgi:hypothetical protein
MDVFRKPLEKFESVRGTPLANFKEPFWIKVYWEIYDREHLEEA